MVIEVDSGSRFTLTGSQNSPNYYNSLQNVSQNRVPADGVNDLQWASNPFLWRSNNTPIHLMVPWVVVAADKCTWKQIRVCRVDLPCLKWTLHGSQKSKELRGRPYCKFTDYLQLLSASTVAVPSLPLAFTANRSCCCRVWHIEAQLLCPLGSMDAHYSTSNFMLWEPALALLNHLFFP